MPYGQIVYRLIDYSAKEKLFSSDIFKDEKGNEIKLSTKDNLVPNGQIWRRVAIQSSPYSRWIVKQNKDNVVNKIIRVGKSGMFEFDKDVEIGYLSYIPTYQNILSEDTTNEKMSESIDGFNSIENERREKIWEFLDGDKVAISVKTSSNIEINAKALWDFIKYYHKDAPGILQFNKEIYVNSEGYIDITSGEKIPANEAEKPWGDNNNFYFTFSLNNNELNDIFNSENNDIKNKYDYYITENEKYQKDFLKYYDIYLQAKKGIYDSSDEILPNNVIIDYYYETEEKENASSITTNT